MDSTLEEAIERCRARYWPEVRHYRELPFLAHEVLEGRMSQTMVSQHTIVAQLSLQAELAITSHGMPKDLFVCSPTGSGKSLMYQLPAVCLNRRHGGLTIVVSPLRALIRDQVTSMQARLRKDKGKITCVYLSSDQTVRQRERALAELEKPGCALLYVSPETFVNDPTLDRVLGRRGQAKERSLGLNLIVVDEAHTVSPWGHEFRLDYYLLGKRIEHLRRGRQAGPVPLACFTATVALDGTGSQADTSVTVSQVVRDLRMNVDLDRDWGETFFFCTRARREIELRVERTDRRPDLTRRARDLVGQGRKALLYCLYRRDVRAATKDVGDERIFGYAGDTGPRNRGKAIRALSDGGPVAIVCTKAFGMGIDAPGIDLVYHADPPESVIDYVQEVGRAARGEGETAQAILRYSEREGVRKPKALSFPRSMREHVGREVLRQVARRAASGGTFVELEPMSFSHLFAEPESGLKVTLVALEEGLRSEGPGEPCLEVIPRLMRGREAPSRRDHAILVRVPDDAKEAFAAEAAAIEGVRDVSLLGEPRGQSRVYEVRVAGVAAGKVRGLLDNDHTNANWTFRDECSRLLIDARGRSWDLMLELLRGRLDAVGRALLELLEVPFEADEVTKVARWRTHDAWDAEAFLEFISDGFVRGASSDGERWRGEAWERSRLLTRREEVVDARRVVATYRVRKGMVVTDSLSWLVGRDVVPDDAADGRFVAYVPIQATPATDERLRLACVLSLLGVADYRCERAGGQSVTVRINDHGALPLRSPMVWENPEVERMVADRERTFAILEAFCRAELTSDERWDVIERHLIGEDVMDYLERHAAVPDGADDGAV